MLLRTKKTKPAPKNKQTTKCTVPASSRHTRTHTHIHTVLSLAKVVLVVLDCKVARSSQLLNSQLGAVGRSSGSFGVDTADKVSQETVQMRPELAIKQIICLRRQRVPHLPAAGKVKNKGILAHFSSDVVRAGQELETVPWGGEEGPQQLLVVNALSQSTHKVTPVLQELLKHLAVGLEHNQASIPPIVVQVWNSRLLSRLPESNT